MKTLSRSLSSSLLATLLVTMSTLASAQWGYTDKDGRRVFSDQAPPSSVPEKNIFRRPAGAPARAATSESEANPSTPVAPTATGLQDAKTAKPAGKDAELEKKKKEAEAQEAAKKKAEQDKQAAARKDNCDRARKAKATYDSGIRIATTNAKGEREILDDAARNAEIKRVNDIIAQDCK
jgi:hypothetical protein